MSGISEGGNNVPKQTTPVKSYAQVASKQKSYESPNFGHPLFLLTQLSSSSGGTTTPISSCSSCHELNNLLDAEGVSILSSNDLKRTLRKTQDLLRRKKETLRHFQSKLSDVRSVIEKETEPDQKLLEFKTELQGFFEQSERYLDNKRKAQSDFNDLQNKLVEWHTKNPDCKTAPKLEHMTSKFAKLQQECDSLKERVDHLDREYKNIGGRTGAGRSKNLAAQDSRAVQNIRASKEKLSNAIKKKDELKFFIDRWTKLQDQIKSEDNLYKELQLKIKELKERSEPLKSAIDLRDKVEKFKSDIAQLENHEKLLNEQRDHIIEQRRLNKLSIENDSTPVRADNNGLHQKHHNSYHRKDSGINKLAARKKFEAAGQLLKTLRTMTGDQPVKRQTVHPEVLTLLDQFALMSEFVEKGPEPCIEFLEKYLKNSPQNLSPPFKSESATPVTSKSEENNSQFGESGYRSLSTGDKATQSVSNDVIDAISTQNTFSSALAPLTDLDTCSGPNLDNESQAPRSSIVEETDEELLTRTFSEQMFTRQVSGSDPLQHIKKESENVSTYINDWMHEASTGTVLPKGEPDQMIDSADVPKKLSESSIDFQNPEEYPPLSAVAAVVSAVSIPEIAAEDQV